MPIFNLVPAGDMMLSPTPQLVTPLTESIKNLLESNFCHIVVKGELSNVSLQPSGHLYFGIKDSKSFLNGAFFHFRSKGGDRCPKNGDSVIIHGKLTVYAPRGQYQIVAHALLYDGEGDLLQQLEERKRRLTLAGYFSSEHKQPIPISPQTIGVITSPTGAVIQDILRVLSRRRPCFHILLYPVTVQGNTAAEEICRAIRTFNEEKLADVLIIARGGGSLEDLWTFNEEILVKAIAASSIPIISAVGHETDYTLCDLAADVRAPTPSAAAEIVYKLNQEQLTRTLDQYFHHVSTHAKQLLSAKTALIQQWKRYFLSLDFFRTAQQTLDYTESAIAQTMESSLQSQKQRYLHTVRMLKVASHAKHMQTVRTAGKMVAQALNHKLSSSRQNLFQIQKSLLERDTTQYVSKFSFLKLSIQRQQHALLTQAKQKHITIQTSGKRLTAQLQQQIRYERHKLKKIAYSIQSAFPFLLAKRKEQYHSLQHRLHALNPKNILQRGYAMLFDFNGGSAIISSQDLQEQKAIKAILQDGEVTFTIANVTIKAREL